MSVIDKINKYLSEAKSKIIVTEKGAKFEVKIIDGTHAEMKMVGTTSRPSALHINQIPDETMKQLKLKGLVSGNFFKSDK